MSELVSVLGVAGITEAELLVAASTFDDDGSDIPGRNPSLFALATGIVRSEERRVGKECRL